MRHEWIGCADLYCGDCREVLPALASGMTVITDPVWPNCPPGLFAGGGDPDGLWRETMLALKEPRRVVAVMRCDSDPRMLRHVPGGLAFFRAIQLPYAIPAYIGRKLGGDGIAYWYGPPIAAGAGRRLVPGRAPVAQPGHRKPNGHPCSRAQVHFEWLACRCSDEGDVIVDPFMGSGTTGAGAMRVGRWFVGIEVDEAYFELACERLEAVAREPDLFSASPRADVCAPSLFSDRV